MFIYKVFRCGRPCIILSSITKYAILCGGMGLVSILMAVYNYRNEGIEYRKKMAKRENDYNRYIAEQEEKIRFIREKEQVISARKYPSIEEHVKFVEDFDARLFEKQKDHDDYL
jgi:S-DNA-T family DNA segregation ATPase FtsK/SpoIIIE